MIIVNYCKLFEELYDEENIIVVINNWLKGLKNRLENKVN